MCIHVFVSEGIYIIFDCMNECNERYQLVNYMIDSAVCSPVLHGLVVIWQPQHVHPCMLPLVLCASHQSCDLDQHLGEGRGEGGRGGRGGERGS